MRPRRLWLYLTAVGLLAVPGRMLAQAPNNLEQTLRENLEPYRGGNQIRGFLDYLKKNPDIFKDSNILQDPEIRKLLENGGKGLDPNDPAFADVKTQVGKILDRANKDPELQKKLQQQVPQLADKKSIEDFKKQLQPRPKPERGPGPLPPPPEPQPQAPQPAVPEDDEEDFARSLRDWLERAKDWGGIGDLVKNSPAINEAINSLTLSMFNGEDGPNLSLDLANRFGDLADYGRRALDGLGGKLPGLGNLPTPQLPQMNLPRLNVGGLVSHLPGLGGPGGGASGFGNFILWLAVLGGFGLILWQILTRVSFQAAREAKEAGWRLGPWPVDPARVATREELIRAFEYLALLRLGPLARSWNHREIAAGLGEPAASQAARQAAADRLAALYEQARYAPGTGPLPGEALAGARRDLCFLAGVAAA